jgi:hypothetical protein
VGGVTLARVVEVINGYTVTFEDGQYAVRLEGANHNIGDVKNVNQVSLVIGNTAGLIVTSSGGGGGATDWTGAERSQIRNRLGIDGVSSPPAAVPTLATPATVWTSANRSLTVVGNQAVIDQLKAEAFDGEPFATIVQRLKAWGYGRFVESAPGVFDYYDDAGTTKLFTLTATETAGLIERVQS